jgi:hypothetical protein
MENETEPKKDWKAIMKQRRKDIYIRMKAQRRAYLDQPEVRERMQIAKFKAKNRRKAFMKKIREERRHKTVKKANTLPY